MPKPEYHARLGWYFQREPDGSVSIRVEPIDPDVLVVTLDAHTWASVVAWVSAAGDNQMTFGEAMRLHMNIGGSADTPTPKEEAHANE